MSSTPLPEEIHVLIHKYLRSALTEQDIDRLLELAEGGPQILDLLFQQLTVDAMMKDILRDNQTHLKESVEVPTVNELGLPFSEHRIEMLPEWIGKTEDASGPKELVTITTPKTLSNAKPVKRREKMAWLPLLGIVVLSLFFGYEVFQEFFPAVDLNDHRRDIIARVTAVADPAFAPGEDVIKKDRRLEKEKIVLSEGLIEMELENGIRMVLEGPGELHLQSVMNVFCNRGRLSVFVPAEAKGFQVETPVTTVIDLGTAFYLNVDEKRSELNVIEGLVEVEQPPKTERFSFAAGKAIRVDGTEMRNIPSDKTLFLSPKQVAERVVSYLEKEEIAYAALLNRFRSDPTLEVLLDSRPDNDISTITVRAPRKQPGFLPERRSLSFRQNTDHVRLSLSKPCKALTLWAMVRLDRLDRLNTLLISERLFDDAGILWQIDRSGAIHFHQRVGAKILTYNSTPIVSPAHEHTWFQLALVVDPEKRTVSHYLDGQEVATLPYVPHPIEIGEVGLGNTLPGRKSHTKRFWNGQIDSLAILNKALSPAELKN